MERQREFLPWDRVRPCLRCGALVAFSAVRCPDCSQPVPGAILTDERVRSCMGCERIVPYGMDPCPHCGRSAQWMDQELTRVKPCAECGNVIPFRQLYCERCGGVSVPLEEDEEESPRMTEVAPRRRPGISIRFGTWPDWVGALVMLAAVISVLVACRRFW